MPKFIIRTPEGVETSFSTDEEDIFIGRIPSINDICISDPTVSRQHAHIKHREEGYTVYDLKSLNGLILNGKRVTRSVLHHGDELLLGDVAIEVRFHEFSSEESLSAIEKSEQTKADLDVAKMARGEKTDPGITQPKSKTSKVKKKKKT